MANALLQKHVSLINFVRTSTSTSYTNTVDREPILHYETDDYDNVDAVYFEANMRAGAAGDTAFMILTSVGGTDVTGSEISTTSTTQARVRSGDIKANLVNNTDYRVRWKMTNVAGGTAAFDTARFIVVQSGQITKTTTFIELAERNNVTTSYAAPTDYATVTYTASEWDGTVEFFAEADLHCNAGGNTCYAQLYDITAGAAVANSEVTHTGDTTTTRKRSVALTLIDGHEYRPDFKGTTTSEDVAAFKLVVKQTGSPTKTVCYLPMLNTMSSGASTTYTEQNREMLFNASDWAGDSVDFDYDATLKSGNGNTAYSNLYNETDAASIADATTTSTTYLHVRNTSPSMPVDDGNTLDHRRKQDTSGTVTVARSYLRARVSWSVDTARRKILLIT